MNFQIIYLIFIVPPTLPNLIIPQNWINVDAPLAVTPYRSLLSAIQSKIPSISRDARITRGRPAKLGQIPHQVLVYISPAYLPQVYLCGGSIISSRWILTAGHCLYQMSNATVFAGVVDRISGRPAWGARINESQLVVHESYSPMTTSDDIGLIDAGSISLGPYVQPIPLPSTRDAGTLLVGKNAEISGWGVTSDGGETAQYLQYAQGPITSNIVCAAFFGQENVQDSHECLDTKTGRSTCSGDSGGPLTTSLNNRKVLVGIVSFGSAFGCELRIPAAFTRVSSYLGWIKQKSGI